MNPTQAGFPLGSIHLLLYPQIPLDQRGVLVTTYDNAVASGSPFTAAVVIASPADERQIALAARRLQAFEDSSIHSSVWYGSLEINAECPSEPQHGFALNIHIHRALLHAWEDDTEEHDDLNLLQPLGRRKHSLEDVAKADVDRAVGNPAVQQQSDHHGSLQLDMQPVLDTLGWYDAYFALPTFDVEVRLAEIAHWHPDSLQWLRLPWYSFDGSVTKLRVYYDGSYIPPRTHTNQIGFAAATFVQQEWVRDLCWSAVWTSTSR